MIMAEFTAWIQVDGHKIEVSFTVRDEDIAAIGFNPRALVADCAREALKDHITWGFEPVGEHVIPIPGAHYPGWL
jgi:hypothetical protein